MKSQNQIFFRKLIEVLSRLHYLAYLLLFLLFTVLPSLVMPELMQSTQTGKFFSFAYSLLAVVVLFLLYNLFSTRPIKVIITSNSV
jgi:Ca2+/H+ antiporter